MSENENDKEEVAEAVAPEAKAAPVETPAGEEEAEAVKEGEEKEIEGE